MSLFGQGVPGLAKKQNISTRQAQDIQNKIFAAVPEFPEYIAKVRKFADEHEGTFTRYGRWNPIPNVHHYCDENGKKDSKNKVHSCKSWREGAYRTAISTTIQGSSTGDISKAAMRRCRKGILETYPEQIRMIMMVHDEILFEVRNDVPPEEAIEFLSGLMRTQFGRVLLEVEAEYGPSWGELQKLPEKAAVTQEPTLTVDARKVGRENASKLLHFLEQFSSDSGFVVEAIDIDGQYVYMPKYADRACLEQVELLNSQKVLIEVSGV